MPQNDLESLMNLVSGYDDDDDDDIGAVDFVGGQDIVAALDIVGATPAQRAKAARILRARQLQRGNVDTVSSMGAKSRRLFLGAGISGVSSPASVVLSIKAQEDYRPDRILITALDSSNAVVQPATILISDIRVGTRSQFASIGQITAEAFQRDFFSNGSDLGLDTIQAGTDLSFELSLLTATGQDLHSANVTCIGRALR